MRCRFLIGLYLCFFSGLCKGLAEKPQTPDLIGLGLIERRGEPRRASNPYLPLRFLVYVGGYNLDVALVAFVEEKGSVTLWWAPTSGLRQPTTKLYRLPQTSCANSVAPLDSDKYLPEFLPQRHCLSTGIRSLGMERIVVSLTDLVVFTWDQRRTYEFGSEDAPAHALVTAGESQNFLLDPSLSYRLSQEFAANPSFVLMQPAPSAMVPLFLFEERVESASQFYVLSAENELSRLSTNTLYGIDYINSKGQGRRLQTTLRSSSGTVQASFSVKTASGSPDTVTLAVNTGVSPSARLVRSNGAAQSLLLVARGDQAIRTELEKKGYRWNDSANIDPGQPCFVQMLQANPSSLIEPL